MIEMYIQRVLYAKMVVSDIPDNYRGNVTNEIKRRYVDGELTEETYNQIKWL